MQTPSVARRNAALASALALTLSAPNAATAAEAVPAQNGAAAPAYANEVPAGLVALGAGHGYYSPYAFVVDKKARTLTVWTQDAGGYAQIAQFPADLGRSDGDKKAQGDHKTPEGAYFLLEKLDGPTLDFSQYGKRAFTTDYPNFFDRRDGKTGNGIWLHAVPDHTPLTRGSRGCVVVRNDVILDLTKYVRLTKTPILIEKEIEFLPAADIKKEAHEITQALEAWRAAWSAKDLDGYISFYDDDFRAMNMNREQWRRYKDGLNGKYQTLDIRLSRPLILRYKDRFVARFLQEYRSDKHADFGEKTVYLRKTSNGVKIVGEEWREDSSQLARDEIQAAATAVSACATEHCPPTAAASSASAN